MRTTRDGARRGRRSTSDRRQPLARAVVLAVVAALIVGGQSSADHQQTTASAASAAPSQVAAGLTKVAELGGDPLAGRRLFVVPDNPAQRAEAALPDDAGALARIARQPTAMWITEDTSLGTVQRMSLLAVAQDALPTFVLYAIPHRDCGSYSAGGFATAALYEAYVDRVAAALGGRPAIVIVEPDALPELAVCGLSAAEQQQRVALIRYAVTRLASPTVSVYIEAGGRYSHPASVAAPVLQAAGLAHAAGFALNVSAFDSTQSEVSYGMALSALTGGSHFVIDTSRNGVGIPPATARGSFCNVPGLGLGENPTAATGNRLLDAYLWVKYPGESDGACGGNAPRSGVFWPAYALGLIARAAA